MARNPGIPIADRLGLSRLQAAEYIGVSPGLFDMMVADKRMPKPKMINRRRVWSRWALEAAFAELPDAVEDGDASSEIWSDVEA